MIPFTLFTSLDNKNKALLQTFNQFSNQVPNVLKRLLSCTYTISLPIPDSSPSYFDVLTAFKESGAYCRLFHYVHYTKCEIENTPFFNLTVSHPLELEGTDSFDYGSKPVGGCQKCGYGSRVDGNVLVDRKLIRKTKIGYVYPELVVSQEVKDVIEANELSGVVFKQNVVDWKGREMAPFYTMHMSPLPPLSSSTWLNPDGFPCKTCGHETTYCQSELRYEAEKLIGAKDFNISSELVDNRHLPRLVVSAKVRKVFNTNGMIRCCGYWPIVLIQQGAPLPFKPDWIN